MLSGTTQIVGFMQNLLSVKKDTATEKTPETKPTEIRTKDQFTFSTATQKALAFLNSEASGENRDPEMDLIEIENLKQRGEMISQMLHMKLESFHGDFLKQMKAAGIDTSQQIDLQNGIDGNLTVMGDHPDKAKIEQLLTGNEDLLKRFQEITNLAGLSQVLQSISGDKGANSFASTAALYAKQSTAELAKKEVGQMQLQITESGATASFE